ncbi:uncharacterized protein with ParB-like and HNH nuclease domain [Parabacteroides sp. PF5-5]|uniref:DUF262 domain-containing protein n=1 Tax=unclassified Parabacteroides TaxID=2649774 RepID=UPI002473DA5A|nr:MULTISPECIES: DUF262 domain-containing HNH endonuclease family protein [unclassified Parabacteroides]MDH6306842.1 uncharacterized protein with ParB-like and HNH nuclease domain [Parabacteroides sp. PH5-39]MDH6316288.1 uncharacterized protein with ParB-like and HNH nuclease domain [Parabacteroides sp. PF5-13]MDH6319771.1 uncharacterized protein with ParB-like and HNH nuclease domain [Parabacteroides sp. PH5-13]MDH6323638.1 uncharacterized protein with ParB-like and HNH nuclease domain [Paraba
MKPISSSISDVLTRNATSFFIPPFQRAYAWGRLEIERYFNDVLRIVRSELNPQEQDKLEHFFGTIVLREERDGFANKSIVVDGQQRLTTTLLFLIALRDIETDSTFKDKITNRYLRNEDSDFDDKIKLKQVTKDWDAYRALVNEEEPNTGIIKAAYQTFIRLINDTLRTSPEIKFSHYTLALQRMNVAVIFLDERPYKGEDPQIIFETLNSLGKALTLADLVRNFILLSLDSKKQSNLYETKWQPIIEMQLNEDTSKFYRDYLQYKTASSIKVVSDEKVDSNTKEVYQLFKEYVNDNFSNREDFANDAICFAPWYRWIITEDVKEQISSSPINDIEIKELLRNIFHDIKSEAFKPFVLGLLEYYQKGVEGIKLNEERLIDILKDIRTYLIRRRILGLAQGENKNIVLLCDKIADLANSNTTMMELLSNMFYKLRIPNDNEVSNQLKTMNFYEGSKKYAKFILGKIEENNAKVSVDFRNPKISIEHVMPQNISDSWRNELGELHEEIHKQYLHNIGNLILTEFNGEIGNKPFGLKKEKLNNSSLYYRIDIITRKTWNKSDIENHRDNMTRWFLDTFPLPERNKTIDNWSTKSIDTTIFSPLDEEAGEIAEGNKPKELKIGSEYFKTGSWQYLFIKLLKWIKNSNVYDYDVIVSNQDRLFGNSDIIITWRNLKRKIEENDSLKKRYKTFDGNFLYSKQTILEDNLELVHVNASARTFINRISGIMNQLGMPENFVEIILK